MPFACAHRAAPRSAAAAAAAVAARPRLTAAPNNTTPAEFEWHEFTGAHAFLRDENSFGRYDPVLAMQTYGMAAEFLHRWLR